MPFCCILAFWHHRFTAIHITNTILSLILSGFITINIISLTHYHLLIPTDATLIKMAAKWVQRLAFGEQNRSGERGKCNGALRA